MDGLIREAPLNSGSANRGPRGWPKTRSRRGWRKTRTLASYPLLEPGTAQGLAPYFLDWLQHPAYDNYWKTWSIEDHYAQIQVPAYHMGGWYDIFMGGTLRNYAGIKAGAGSEAARRGQRLMIGPWYHGPFNGKTGDVDFGPESRMEESDDLILRWYDYLLKGIPNGMENEKPVKIFVM